MKHLTIKLILAAFLLHAGFSTQAQVYTAGAPLSTYVDINPDTLINDSYFYPHESYYFDINGDFINDLELEASFSNSPGFTSSYISINPLDSNSSISFGKIDSSYNTYLAGWMTDRVAKPLNYGDTINSPQAIWDHSHLFLTDSYYVAGSTLSVTDWSTLTTDRYIGVKYQNVADTIFGWIRVNCHGAGCTVKDYSFNALPLNVEEFSSAKVVVYPNPASTFIHIESASAYSQIQITDVIGSIVKQKNASIENAEMDVSDLSNGIYFVSVKTKNGIFTKKIIVQR
ncbi:MAG: glycosyl hydrolase [Bacteroidetes bacterium]|nr:glycosyl hydrolase [Bacteroidota bacterium]